jgi:hypothetical protein
MTIVRALIRKDPETGKLVGWVPLLMPAARCESDDFMALKEELERTVYRVLEQQQPGSTENGIRIETASVI